MSEPERHFMRSTRGIEISHRFGANEDYGDITLDAEALHDSFEIDFDRCSGRDRDNYRASHHGALKLNVEEAQELLLLLSMWVEQQQDIAARVAAGEYMGCGCSDFPKTIENGKCTGCGQPYWPERDPQAGKRRKRLVKADPSRLTHRA